MLKKDRKTHVVNAEHPVESKGHSPSSCGFVFYRSSHWDQKKMPKDDGVLLLM